MLNGIIVITLEPANKKDKVVYTTHLDLHHSEVWLGFTACVIFPEHLFHLLTRIG